MISLRFLSWLASSLWHLRRREKPSSFLIFSPDDVCGLENGAPILQNGESIGQVIWAESWGNHRRLKIELYQPVSKSVYWRKREIGECFWLEAVPGFASQGETR
jgi:hypothetical protein